MVIYNVTIKVDWAIAENWVKWMQEEHIPEVMETGCFKKHRFVRLLQIDEADGPTYAVQYFATMLSSYDEYLAHHAPALRQKSLNKWGNSFVAFRTLMQEVEK